MKGKRIAFSFWLLALFCLVFGLLFGMAGSLQYVFTGMLKEQFSFAKMRPLHVFLITQWISCAAIGGMYYFIPSVRNKGLFSPLLAKLHLFINIFIVMVAVSDFLNGKFTGREYMEFPLWIVALMISGWILAGINLLATVKPSYNTAPVYIWSWSTGILFFIITLTEASLWQFDHFNANIIRDITVQWKAMGSMVGAWNQLIYGSAMFLMCRISGSDKIARSKEAFFFYFLGMANLMFNWGHHTYVVPASPAIKMTAYIISMTELLILFNMIWKWLKTLNQEDKELHQSWRLLKMTDNWILLNLFLAIAISVPALNMYTHGTHITVAHAMGATIGINTTILLACALYIYFQERRSALPHMSKTFRRSLTVFNVSLLVFWISLVGMGIVKAAAVQQHTVFAEIMHKLQPWFRVFSASGFVLTAAIVVMVAPLIRQFTGSIIRHKPESASQRKPLTKVITIAEKEKQEPFSVTSDRS
ncbi:MAG TPA: cbb3-type cytochrome c oxidase subunit I [Chitinophagaceae bacterium]